MIIWYDDEDIITDLEIYYLSNDFDILFKDYYFIKKAIDNGEFKVVGGVIYDTVDSLTGHPYRLIKQLEEVA